MAKAKPSTPKVKRLTAAEGNPSDITPPADCCATVLLREVGHDDERKERYFAWWLVVGRDGATALTVPYKFDGAFTLRFDIPDDTLLSTDYMQDALTTWWKTDQHLPPDTPIIKG